LLPGLRGLRRRLLLPGLLPDPLPDMTHPIAFHLGTILIDAIESGEFIKVEEIIYPRQQGTKQTPGINQNQ
jgi:hypothetical protein